MRGSTKMKPPNDKLQNTIDKYNSALDKELAKHNFSVEEKIAFTLGVQFQMDRSFKMIQKIGK